MDYLDISCSTTSSEYFDFQLNKTAPLLTKIHSFKIGGLKTKTKKLRKKTLMECYFGFSSSDQ